MKHYRVTIAQHGQADITVSIEAHSADEARRIATAQFPQGHIINIYPA